MHAVEFLEEIVAPKLAVEVLEKLQQTVQIVPQRVVVQDTTSLGAEPELLAPQQSAELGLFAIQM